MVEGSSPNCGLVNLKLQFGNFQFVVCCSLNYNLSFFYHFDLIFLFLLSHKNTFDHKSNTE